MIKLKSPCGAHTLLASLHPTTRNLRLKLVTDEGSKLQFFFAGDEQALEWLDDVGDLVEGTAEGSDAS